MAVSGAQPPKPSSLLERRRQKFQTAPARSLLEAPREAEGEDAAEPKLRRCATQATPLVLDCGRVMEELAGLDCPFAASTSSRLREQYEVLEALGQGTTGVVYAALRKEDSEKVAIKVMRMHDMELLSVAQMEFQLLCSVEHSHVIRALDFFTYSMGAVLVMEYFGDTSLEKAVGDAPRGCFCEATSQRLFRPLIDAVGYLHSHSIIHRDIKAENILVSQDLRDLRLVDFNTARRISKGSLVSLAGTINYMPPEALVEGNMSEGCDVWASGLCLHLMLFGDLPFERSLFVSAEEFGRAVRAAPPLSPAALRHLSGPCTKSLQRCLEVDPNRRPTAAEMLSSDWLCTNMLLHV